MTHGDSFQQIAALRAEFQRAAAEVNILREIVLQLRREFDNYVQQGAILTKENEPELLRANIPIGEWPANPDPAAEGLNVPEPDMGPEV